MPQKSLLLCTFFVKRLQTENHKGVRTIKLLEMWGIGSVKFLLIINQCLR